MKLENENSNQQLMNDILWKVIETSRNVWEPFKYKDYILAILFLKYLNDAWKEQCQMRQLGSGDDLNIMQNNMPMRRFVLPEQGAFDYIVGQKDEPDIGVRINKALQVVEEANKPELEGVFRDIDFSKGTNSGLKKDRNNMLKALIEELGALKFNFPPSSIDSKCLISNAYTQIVERFASNAGKKGDEFYTPTEVGRLLGKLLNPGPGNQICDPVIGSGSLAIAVASEIGDCNFKIYGQESNRSTWALCKINMFVHGISSARIEYGDTLNDPKLVRNNQLMQFDIVVARPSFSSNSWGADRASEDQYQRFHRGISPKSKPDFAFISHMIEIAEPGHGRVGVIVPHGALFRGGSEGLIRRNLVDENLLDAVIGLPERLFYEAGIPAVILIFDKGKKTNDVLFINASKEFEQGKYQNKLAESHIEKIVKTFRERLSLKKYSRNVTLQEIWDNEYNLNVSRYVNVFEDEQEIDAITIEREIESIERELQCVRAEMQQHLGKLSL
ncbi:MAG: type restriction-modification system, subunit [Chlorobi bacterium]|nr:type restriction-modification system, subunit [Chlorobiota bacterium]